MSAGGGRRAAALGAIGAALFGLSSGAGVATGQDPDAEWKQICTRAGQARDSGDALTALELFRLAAKMRPDESCVSTWLCQIYQDVGLLQTALETASRGIDQFKARRAHYNQEPMWLVQFYEQRAQLYLYLGEPVKCKEDVAEALKINPKTPSSHLDLGECFANAGEFDKAIAEVDRAVENADPDPRVKSQGFLLQRAAVRRMKGDNEGARADLERLMADKGVNTFGSSFSAVGYAGAAILYSLAEDPKVRDMKKARELLDTAVKIDTRFSDVTKARAIVSLFEGDAATALQYFATLADWAVETHFYHGLAQLRAGSHARAVELFVRAAEVNPGFRKRIESDPELAPVRVEVLAMVKELGRRNADDRMAVRSELDSNPVTLAYVEGLAKTRKYAAAADAMERFAKQARADTARDAAAQRAKSFRAYATLHERLVKAVAKGRFKDAKLKLGDSDATLVTADSDTVELTASGGSVKGPWAILPFDSYFKLVNDLSSGEEDWFTAGLLCFDNDRVTLGEASFSKCLGKGASYQAKIDEVVAAKRGVGAPEGGFVAYAGRLVTADERDKLKKGLVLFRGQWVTKEDKEHLTKNHEKSDGKWVPLTEAQLQARGFVKYKGDWRTKEEVARLKGDWSDAWTLETEHYEIRTNKSEACLKTLGTALEDAYAATGSSSGGRHPRGR